MYFRSALRWVLTLVTLAGVRQSARAQEHISDNSFLIEEAYNQEPGVVQHIFNWAPTWDNVDDAREFTFLYLMELPIGGQTHQFSFTPMVFKDFSTAPAGSPPEEEGGWGDTLVNYRYQLAMEEEGSWMPAMAPRFSVILPTGDEDRGLGTGEAGYQFNLPISKELESFALHFNAGVTSTPNVFAAGSPERDLTAYNLGGSVVWLADYDFNVFVECVTFWDEELDDLGGRDRTTSVILNPGFRCALFTGEEVQWVTGVGCPVGLSEDAPDIGVFVYMSVEHNFRSVD